MRASRHVLVVGVAHLLIFWTPIFCISIFCLSSIVDAQQSDQAVAERVLGPQWKRLARRAGMIFTGTVLSTAERSAAAPAPGTIPSLALTFRVDAAIAGVEPGQVLTIHEWAGAWSMQRAMLRGQRFLIFLYPPSRLGLTSPVGGSLGQIALDTTGENVIELPAAMSRRKQSFAQADTSFKETVNEEIKQDVSVVQLERAIRSARKEEE